MKKHVGKQRATFGACSGSMALVCSSVELGHASSSEVCRSRYRTSSRCPPSRARLLLRFHTPSISDGVVADISGFNRLQTRVEANGIRSHRLGCARRSGLSGGNASSWRTTTPPSEGAGAAAPVATRGGCASEALLRALCSMSSTETQPGGRVRIAAQPERWGRCVHIMHASGAPRDRVPMCFRALGRVYEDPCPETAVGGSRWACNRSVIAKVSAIQ